MLKSTMLKSPGIQTSLITKSIMFILLFSTSNKLLHVKEQCIVLTIVGLELTSKISKKSISRKWIDRIF